MQLKNNAAVVKKLKKMFRRDVPRAPCMEGHVRSPSQTLPEPHYETHSFAWYWTTLAADADDNRQ